MKMGQPEMKPMFVLEASQEMLAFWEVVSQVLSNSRSDCDMKKNSSSCLVRIQGLIPKPALRERNPPHSPRNPSSSWLHGIVNQKQVTCICTYPVTWGQNSNWNEKRKQQPFQYCLGTFFPISCTADLQFRK